MKKRKSVMTHQFSQVPSANIPRSVFNRTHGHKTTLNSGYLVPFYVDECLPGDTFSVNATMFARLATPIVPIMDNMHMDSFYFAVPIRLIWDNFQKMMGEQANPEDSTDFLVPQMVSPEPAGYAVGEISDYFGIPTKVPGLTHSSLWHRAYALIFNEWFRDENLQNSIPIDKGDGPDLSTNFVLQRRGKRHDYFTSALPWPQKGPGVQLPLGTSAPVIGNGFNVGWASGSSTVGTWIDTTSATFRVDGPTGLSAGASVSAPGSSTMGPNQAVGLSRTAALSGMVADLSSATAATINSLRQAFQMQKLLERDARGGTRYTEIVRSHFGTVSPDSRLQRPEYLGGGSAPVNINPVAQTTQTAEAGTPQGNLAGFGTVESGRNGFSKSFTEHCVIIGLVSVRADLTYQTGLPRMFSRRSRFDFYWPALAHLGEQEIRNKEIWATGSGNPTQDDAVFGYQERWAEYRYYPSKITGKFRSTDDQSLDIWHLSQKFESLPTLSSQFIEDNPPIDRIIAVKTEPQFIFDSYIEMRTARPIPTYSVPGLIDHF